MVLNPSAGGGDAVEHAEQLQKLVTRAGHTLDITMPGGEAEVEAVVRRGVAAGYERILAAGGDGTLNRMIPALADTGVPLGIVPLGTVNVLAREFGLPLEPERALQVAMHGVERRVDLGVANGRLFALMAGLGFDAQVISEIVPRLKDLFGPLAYITAGLQVLTRYKSSILKLEGDDFSLELPAWLMVVGNAGYYAYELDMAPDACMDDGLLDVCIFAEKSALDRLTQISALFMGQHTRHPNVRNFRTAGLRISATPPVHVQLDGDTVGMSPVDISVRPRALSVIVPAQGE